MSGTMKFTDSPEQAAVVQAPSYADVVVVAGARSEERRVGKECRL